MQFLFIFVACGCFVSAFCDAECFKKDNIRCNEEYFKDYKSHEEFDVCKFQKASARCMVESAVTCNMKFITEAKAFQAVIDESCEKGTKLNKAIEENRQCIEKSMTDTTCNPLFKLIKENPTPSQILEAQKEYCRQIYSIANCLIEKVKENCGADGLSAFERLYEPSMELHKPICRDVILPAKLDQSEPDLLNGPLEFII